MPVFGQIWPFFVPFRPMPVSTWDTLGIKIPKPPYISSQKMVGSVHFSNFLIPSEKYYKLQSCWITLYQDFEFDLGLSLAPNGSVALLLWRLSSFRQTLKMWIIPTKVGNIDNHHSVCLLFALWEQILVPFLVVQADGTSFELVEGLWFA